MELDTNILAKAIPAFLLLITVEGIFQAKEYRAANMKKQVLASFLLGAGFVAMSPLTKGMMLFCFSLAYEYRICNAPDYIWITWILCFIGDDFTYYWFHRMSHQVRFLWASHMVHHSAEHLSFSAAFRQPWTSHISGTFLFWIWMPFLGFTPAMVIFAKSINVIYQFGLHTEMIGRLPGWIEFIFNTPSHHRVHHASNPEYLDKNHGGVLIIWDRLFGTYQHEIKKPIYGLTKNIPSQNPIVITFYEWRKIYNDLRNAKGWRECFQYLFNAPGWPLKTLSDTKGRFASFKCKKNRGSNDSACKQCKGCTSVVKHLSSLRDVKPIG